MNINGIIYFLIILFSFILLNSFLFPIREGLDDLVNMTDLKIEVAQSNIDNICRPNAVETGNFLLNNIDNLNISSGPQPPSAEVTGNFLLNNIDNIDIS